MVRGSSHQSEIWTEQIQWTGHRSGECWKVNVTSVFPFFFLSFFPSFFSFHEYAWLMQMTTIFDWRDLNVSRLSNRLRSKKQVLSPPLSVNCQSTVSLSCQTFVLYWLHDKGLIVLDLSNCGSLYWSKKDSYMICALVPLDTEEFVNYVEINSAEYNCFFIYEHVNFDIWSKFSMLDAYLSPILLSLITHLINILTPILLIFA